MNALVFNQAVHGFEIAGIAFGVGSTLLITLWDELLAKLRAPPSC